VDVVAFCQIQSDESIFMPGEHLLLLARQQVEGETALWSTSRPTIGNFSSCNSAIAASLGRDSRSAELGHAAQPKCGAPKLAAELG